MLTILVICFSNSGNFAVVCEVWFRVQSSEFIRAYSLHTLDKSTVSNNKTSAPLRLTVQASLSPGARRNHNQRRTVYLNLGPGVVTCLPPRPAILTH